MFLEVGALHYRVLFPHIERTYSLKLSQISMWWGMNLKEKIAIKQGVKIMIWSV
jgi:hypothetical protein